MRIDSINNINELNVRKIQQIESYKNISQINKQLAKEANSTKPSLDGSNQHVIETKNAVKNLISGNYIDNFA